MAFEERQLNQRGMRDSDGPIVSLVLMPWSTQNSGEARVIGALPLRTMGGPAESIALEGRAPMLHPIRVSARVRLDHAISRAAAG